MSTYKTKRLQRITVLAALLALVLIGSLSSPAKAEVDDPEVSIQPDYVLAIWENAGE